MKEPKFVINEMINYARNYANNQKMYLVQH